MRLFLFAIGGTGARVVRSLTMMLASGIDGLDSSTEIIPIIIDYDLSNGDKSRAISALRHYSDIHQTLYPDSVKGTLYDNHFFMTRITELSKAGVAGGAGGGKDFEFNFGPTGSSIKFADYLKMSTLDTTRASLTQSLLNALYDDSDDTCKDAELQLDMAKGFKGNPNIGTVVFHDLRDMPEFQQFAGTSNAATDRVFIISSIFGGTGASGFPEIVNAIRNNSHSTLKPATIGAALVLPYFDLQQFNPTLGDTGAVDAGLFNAKTRAALGFYAGNNGINQQVNALYYVGDENRDAYHYHEGEDRQKNDAHVVEFVAATSIIDFLQRCNDQTIKNTDHRAFEFSVKDAKLSECLQLPDFEDSTHTLLLNNLSAFAIAMKFYRDVVCGDRAAESSGTAYFSSTRFDLGSKKGRGVYALLDQFLDANGTNEWGFYHWLEELNSHTHKLNLYRMGKQYEMKMVLSHKTIESGFLSANPIKDSELKTELNKASTQPPYSDQAFFKVLHDVAKNKYMSVK